MRIMSTRVVGPGDWVIPGPDGGGLRPVRSATRSERGWLLLPAPTQPSEQRRTAEDQSRTADDHSRRGATCDGKGGGRRADADRDRRRLGLGFGLRLGLRGRGCLRWLGGRGGRVRSCRGGGGRFRVGEVVVGSPVTAVESTGLAPAAAQAGTATRPITPIANTASASRASRFLVMVPPRCHLLSRFYVQSAFHPDKDGFVRSLAKLGFPKMRE